MVWKKKRNNVGREERDKNWVRGPERCINGQSPVDALFSVWIVGDSCSYIIQLIPSCQEQYWFGKKIEMEVMFLHVHFLPTYSCWWSSIQKYGKELVRKWSLTCWVGLDEGSARSSVLMDLTCYLLQHRPLRRFCAQQHQSHVMCNEVCVPSSPVFCRAHGDHFWCIKRLPLHSQNTHLKASVLKPK